MRRRLRASAPGFAATVVGFVLGLVLVLTYPDRTAPLWLLWAPLALALSTASGALFVYGLRRWVDLIALHPVRVSDVAAPVVAAELSAFWASMCRSSSRVRHMQIRGIRCSSHSPSWPGSPPEESCTVFVKSPPAPHCAAPPEESLHCWLACDDFSSGFLPPLDRL
jgi:hypothetical protein